MRITRSRRHTTALLAALATTGLCLAAAGPASAIQSVQKFSFKVSPTTAGTKAKPRAVSLTANPFFDTNAPDLDRQVQFATVNATVYFPKGGVYNGKYFKSCTATTVFQDEKQCPKGSRVGTASGRGLGIGLDEAVKGQFFNLKGGKGATLLVTGESPLIIREVVAAKLTKLSSDPNFSYKLTFTVPRNLQSPAPGVIATVMRFQSTFPRQYVTRTTSRGRTKVPLIASTSCPKGGWKYRFIADYTTSFDGAVESSQTVNGSLNCKRAG